MAIQGTQVPMYTNTLFFFFFLFIFILKTKQNKTKQPNKNRQTTYVRKMHMHEGKIEGCRCMKA